MTILKFQLYLPILRYLVKNMLAKTQTSPIAHVDRFISCIPTCICTCCSSREPLIIKIMKPHLEKVHERENTSTTTSRLQKYCTIWHKGPKSRGYSQVLPYSQPAEDRK